jgi:hypothetical protein
MTRDLGAVLQGHTWGRGGSFVAESVKASGSFPKSGASFSRRTGLLSAGAPSSLAPPCGSLPLPINLVGPSVPPGKLQYVGRLRIREICGKSPPRNGMVWYGMVWCPLNPHQCVPVTEGGGFIQHLPTREASGPGRPVNQRLFEDGFACAGGGGCTSCCAPTQPNSSGWRCDAPVARTPVALQADVQAGRRA